MGKIKKKVQQRASQIKKTAGWAKKELTDRRILDLASAPYESIKKRIAATKDSFDNVDFDSKIALQVGAQILKRAQAVRQSLKKKKTPNTDED